MELESQKGSGRAFTHFDSSIVISNKNLLKKFSLNSHKKLH